MSLRRAIATVAGFTAISRVMGFIRDIVMAGLMGTGFVADCFVIAFKLPNFFRRLFAEGAFNAAFVPLFTEKLRAKDDGERDESRDQAIRFAEDSFAVLLVVLFVFVALAQLAMPAVMLVLANGFKDDPAKFELAVTLTRITFPYLLFISLVSLLGGVLNSLGRFAAVAGTPIILNASLIVAGLALSSALPTPGHALAIGVSVGGALQFVWLVVALRREGVRMRLRLPRLTPEVKRLLVLMMPVALGAGAMQVNLLIDILIASFLPEGSLAFLFYADRLNQLPIGIVGVAVGTALLPTLSRQIADGREDAANDSLNRAVETALLLTTPAAVALILIPGPILTVLFERGAFTADSTAATAAALTAYALGLPAYVLVKVLGPAFFARQDTVTPVRFAIIALVVNTALNLILMIPLKHVGLALATALSAWLNAALLSGALLRRGAWRMDARLKSRALRGTFSAGLMGGALWLGAQMLAGPLSAGEAVRAPALLFLIAGGGAVFAVAAHMSGALTFGEIRRLVRRSPESSDPAPVDRAS